MLSVYDGIQKVTALAPDNPRAKIVYANAMMAFDIETTRVEDDNAIMYIWQCGLYVGGEYYITYGRTWEEWTALQEAINARLGGITIICLVHNLSYEFQFLAGLYEFSDVKCLKARKILSATCGCIEYRCSYIWTNKTLSKFLKEMNVQHLKKSGAEFDYSKARYPWTKLSEAEIEYCQNDVIGLLEAAEKKISQDGDTLYTVPRTSTGYVRRDAKQALSQTPLGALKPTEDIYRKLRKAFRGGNTHANRYFVGKVLTGVQSVDRSSSYSDVMLNNKFPMKPFKQCPDGIATIRRAFSSGLAILCTMSITGATLRNPLWGCPYIPVSKCQMLINSAEDNGRVLEADALTIEVTEVDIQIIIEEYDGEFDFTDIYTAEKDYLPKPFTDCIKRYYTNKTSLKGISGSEYEYMKSKNLLNSLYGMTATDPGKDDIIFDGGEYIQKETDVIKNIKKSFLPYQWGVWITAYARLELEEMINIAGNNFVYGDTDSCKYIKSESISYEDYNNRHKSASLAHGACAVDPNGIMHYMGVAETEGEYYQFLTWGAKKYASQDVQGHINITIAGVRKNSSKNASGEIVEWGGGDELEEAGGLVKFAPGFVFRKSGGLEIVYNDHVCKTISVDGHELKITRNVCLRPSSYAVGITNKYADLIGALQNSYISIDADRNLCYNLIRR
jgi:hypothetical protein